MKVNNLYQSSKKIMALTLPISATSLINMISSFIAMRFVAQLGKLELAAGALSVTTFITVMTIVATIFYAISILISHYRAQQKPATAIGDLVKNGFWLAILLAIPASIALWNVDKLLAIFGEDPKLVELTQGYFHFAAVSIFPILILSVISQFYTGIGKPKFMLWFAIIGFPIIIFFSYAFILGKFGFPELGLAGITCAAMCMQVLFCIGILIHIYFEKSFQSYKIFSNGFWPQWSLCKSIFTLGMPIGIQFGGELAAMTLAAYFMGYLGVVALAGSQIVSQYAMLIVMIILSLSQALAVLVSEAYGKSNAELVKQYIIAALLIFCGISIGMFLIFTLMPNVLIMFFMHTTDADLIHLTSDLFIISAVLLFFDGIRNLYSGALRGMQDSKTPMKIGVFCLWVISIPICYLTAFTFHGGPIGLRIGFLSGFLVAAFLLWRRISYKLKLVDTPPENLQPSSV